MNDWTRFVHPTDEVSTVKDYAILVGVIVLALVALALASTSPVTF